MEKYLIQCIIVDDESKAITALTYELNQLADVEVNILASFINAKDAISFLDGKSTQEVNVVFLDVEMPGLGGLEFLEAFPNRTFEVIFTTAHSQYAIKAIRKDAFDYLVKPIDGQDLAKAMCRLVESRVGKDHVQERLLNALEKLDKLETGHRIKLSIDRKLIFLDPDEIVYCESDGNYCRIFLEHGDPLFLTQKLKAVGQLLPEYVFFRVHNSYIVNLKKVKEYHKVEAYLVMSNGKKIPVSRQKRGDILNQF